MNPEIKTEITKAGPVKEHGAIQENKDTKKYPCDILMDLSTKIPSILVKAAMEILENNTQAEYVELAVSLLNDALKYDSLDSHARVCNELIWKSAEKIRNRKTVNDIHG